MTMDPNGNCSTITCVVRGAVCAGLPVFTTGETSAQLTGYMKDALPPTIVVFADAKECSAHCWFVGVAASNKDPAHNTCAVVTSGICRMLLRLAASDATHRPTGLLRFDVNATLDVGGTSVPAVRAVVDNADAVSLVGVLMAYGDGELGPHRVLLYVGLGHLDAHAAAKHAAPAAAAVERDHLALLTPTKLDALRCSGLTGMICSRIAQLVLISKDAGASDFPLAGERRAGETDELFDFRRDVYTEIVRLCDGTDACAERWSRALKECVGI